MWNNKFMGSAFRVRAAATWCLLVACALPLAAQTPSYDVGGYVKDLVSYTDATTGSGFDNLLHARLNTKWYLTSMFTGALEVRFRAYAGHTVETTPGFVDLIRSHHDVANLDACCGARLRASVIWRPIDSGLR